MTEALKADEFRATTGHIHEDLVVIAQRANQALHSGHTSEAVSSYDTKKSDRFRRYTAISIRCAELVWHLHADKTAKDYAEDTSKRSADDLLTIPEAITQTQVDPRTIESEEFSFICSVLGIDDATANQGLSQAMRAAIYQPSKLSDTAYEALGKALVRRP